MKRQKPIAIYCFDEGKKNVKTWVALYKEGKSSSWTDRPFYGKEDFVTKIAHGFIGIPRPVSGAYREELIRECYNGKHEDCCIWRAENTEVITTSKCTCNILLGCTCEAGRAELEKERANNG